METEKKTGHGGARRGAGRKPNGRNIPLAVRVSPESARVLEGIDNKSEYIDNLIKNNAKI